MRKENLSRFLPIKGDRYYSREEILPHLNRLGRKILIPGFRKDNQYRITDYLLVSCISRALYVSAVVGVMLLACSLLLYRDDYFGSSSFFLSLYKRDDLGFAAYYAFLHSAIAGVIVLIVCIFHMVLLILKAKPVFVPILDLSGYRKERLDDKKNRKKLYFILTFFGLISAFGGFTVPSMIIDWFHLPQSVGDSAVYTIMAYGVVVVSQGIAALLLFLSFIVFYGTRANHEIRKDR